LNENLLFISYRRADSSPHSLALRLELERNLRAANVFLDTKTIRSGVNWPEYIQNALDAANVVLVLIGPLWLGLDESGTRRIDDPEDWVRREVHYALSHKPNRVLPILLDGASPLREQHLPADIRGLASIQPDSLHLESWSRDIDALLAAIHVNFGYTEKTTSFRFPKPDPLKAKTNLTKSDSALAGRAARIWALARVRD